ncbi:hypothetical protein B0H19DRAFT_1251967 [Mycena capillaripes]|nr:hypothetical protein B0H19DRAFT_1251967 [Mycena capillaripes]
MKTPLLLAAAFAVSVALASDIEIESTQREPCTIHAWVRAEDLAPDHVSRGELRIKVPRAECANQIASVALRLQLDEFGEVKFLKQGAVLPEVQSSNKSVSAGYTDWVGSDVVYDYRAHDEGLTDPELWTIKAEERHAWTTEATLIENNPDLSQPIVTPFSVAVPAVNYPPAVNRYVYRRSPISRHTSSDLGYRYIAAVTFTDGRTEDVLAGHTTFVPSPPASIKVAPISWNVTFMDFTCNREDDSPASKKHAEELERCLPEAKRSVFIAEITLEEGTVVQKSRPLKGRVTVRSISNGSTTMSNIYVHLVTQTTNQWAQNQAAAGGDVQFFNATSGACQQSSGHRALDPESINFAHVFRKKDDDWTVNFHHLSVNGPLTPAQPYLDFEFEVPLDTPVDFALYYADIKNLLQFDLTVQYSSDAAKCIYPRSLMQPEDENVDDATRTEEGLWDTYTRVSVEVAQPARWGGSLSLRATVPVTVVGSTSPVPAAAHYLTPGVAAPVLRRGAQHKIPASFPVANPVFTAEALVNTSARLMQPGSTNRYQPFTNLTLHNTKYPDPTENYRGGSYAGVLWKKKVVAEERGIWPLRPGTEVVDGADAQQPFFTTP